jgi:DNA polymerase-4
VDNTDNAGVRAQPSVLHMDLDAFFAAVEQRDKPSLRGKPVVVGGLGGRGVVATASYEARRSGVRSAMPMAEARSRAPHAAFLAGRFAAYRATSEAVMAAVRELSPLVEPLSFDEAFVDLTATGDPPGTTAAATAVGERFKAAVFRVSGGLTCSVGIASSKLVAKIASELDKPDGLVVVPVGTERELLGPLDVSVLPGVGPATTERLRRIGVHTVEQLQQVPEEELVSMLGQAAGRSLARLAQAEDDRAVLSERESKSVSVEDTFEHDVVDQALLASIVARHAHRVAERLRTGELSGRTVTVKIRRHDFTTHTRSATLRGPTDEARVVARLAGTLLAEMDVSGGVRLVGVGVSGLADWSQADLFTGYDEPGAPIELSGDEPAPMRRVRWAAGMDVVHAMHGAGWVWGSGVGRVTVRFETAETGPGPVHTFAADDPELSPAPPPAIPPPP